MNLDLWPYNPQSQTPDSFIQWDNAGTPFELTEHLIGILPMDDLSRLTKPQAGKQWNSLSEAQKTAVRTRLAGGVMVRSATLTPIEVTTVAARMLQIESARATIPVESILQLMLTAVATGVMEGQPISARDRVDLAKFLVNKILPDAKNVDTEEKSRFVDRKKRSKEDFSADELRNMTKEELLSVLDS